MKADLHLHSTASDGRLSPKELVAVAAARGLTYIALTDHDSISGIPPALQAARSHPSLTIIPGVEIDTDIPHGEVHILGYFIDYESAELQATLEGLRQARRTRALKMLAKLRELGIAIDWERVQQIAGGGSIGRPHIAQAMFEKGYIPSLKEAFIKYIGREGPAYAEREKVTPEEVVRTVLRARGVPVLAHPGDIEPLEELLKRLKAVGLQGLEAYYNGYREQIVQGLLALAHKYDLAPTGGSDYHGLDSRTETPIGGVQLPTTSLERFLALGRAAPEKSSRGATS